MNNMNMPGFTAEASLYQTNEHYPAEATTVPSANQVVPQYGLCDKAAYYCNRGYEKWCDVLDNVCFSDV